MPSEQGRKGEKGGKMQDKMNRKQNVQTDILTLATCEAAVVILVILGGLALDMGGIYGFDFKIILGAIFGAIVTLANYVVLTISLDRAVKSYLELRGDREMDEEEAEAFAKANSAPIQNAIKRSSTLRTLTLIAALLLAFITKMFNPIATVIPILAYRPLLTTIELIKAKRAPAPNPEKYIKYDYNDEEKESE